MPIISTYVEVAKFLPLFKEDSLVDTRRFYLLKDGRSKQVIDDIVEQQFAGSELMIYMETPRAIEREIIEDHDLTFYIYGLKKFWETFHECEVSFRRKDHEKDPATSYFDLNAQDNHLSITTDKQGPVITFTFNNCEYLKNLVEGYRRLLRSNHYEMTEKEKKDFNSLERILQIGEELEKKHPELIPLAKKLLKNGEKLMKDSLTFLSDALKDDEDVKNGEIYLNEFINFLKKEDYGSARKVYQERKLEPGYLGEGYLSGYFLIKLVDELETAKTELNPEKFNKLKELYEELEKIDKLL